MLYEYEYRVFDIEWLSGEERSKKKRWTIIIREKMFQTEAYSFICERGRLKYMSITIINII